MNNRRREAIEKLGGLKCRGLSFIGGPDCPVPPELLIGEDINIGHRKSEEGNRNGRAENQVFKEKNPHDKFILLCTLCNQRMRHLAKEFRFREIPSECTRLYEAGWTLELLAEKYDCCYSVISKYLKRNGVRVRPGA